MNIKIILILYSILLIANYTHSQHIDSIQVIEEIHIQGERPIVAISPKTIQNTGNEIGSTETISELIRNNSSIFIKSYGQGGLSTISFMGTNASHTKAIWNGVNLNSPLNGSFDFNLIPASLGERIDIHYGNASISKSTGGIGGIIDIRNDLKFNEGLRTSIQLSAGSFHTYGATIKHSHGYEKLSMSAILNAYQSKNNFPYKNIANGLFNKERQRFGDFNNLNLLYNLKYLLNSKTQLKFHFWSQNSQRSLPPIMSYSGDGRDENQHDKSITSVASLSYISSLISHRASLSYRYTLLSYYLSHQTIVGEYVQFDNDFITHSPAFRYELKYRPKKLNLGLKLVSQYNYAIKNERLKEISSFYNRIENEILATGEYKLLHNLKLGSSIGMKFYDQKFTPLIYNIQMVYVMDSTKKRILSLSYGSNSHIPTLNDLYWVPGGNSELKPEVSKGIIIDYTEDYTIGNIRISSPIKVYASVIDDWIMWRPSQYSYWIADNLNKVFSRGIELSPHLSYVYKNWSFETKFIYAYTRTSNQSSENTFKLDQPQLIYIPKHKMNILQSIDWKNITAEYHIYYVSQRFTTSSNIERRHILNAYSLHNLKIQYTHDMIHNRELQLVCNFKNLFNIQYQSILWRPMPGFNFNFSIKIQL